MAETRYYFAGVNRVGPLADSTKSEDVLVSFADILRTPSIWGWMKPLIESGHWDRVILDSGAFTELTERKRGKVFKVAVEDYATFASKWIAPRARSLPGGSFDIDLDVAHEFGLQARTVARRLARLAKRIVEAVKAATSERAFA